jgi:hypothetical protein
MPDKILATMRTMAYERAMGELRSMLATYKDEPIRYNKMERLINELKIQVDEEYLQF